MLRALHIWSALPLTQDLRVSEAPFITMHKVCQEDEETWHVIYSGSCDYTTGHYAYSKKCWQEWSRLLFILAHRERAFSASVVKLEDLFLLNAYSCGGEWWLVFKVIAH